MRSWIGSRARGALVSGMRTTTRTIGLDIRRLDRRAATTMLGIADRDIRTVIDVGANKGDFLRAAAKLFPAARFVAFEPLAELAELLPRVGSELGVDLRVVCSAIGDQAGTVTLHRHEHLPSSSVLANGRQLASIYPFAASSTPAEVPITTLDAALDGEILEREVLVKLDVQGFEDRVLRGGRRVMAGATACILEVLIADLYDGQTSFDEVHELLRGSGLHFAGVLDQVIGEDGGAIYLDAVYLRPRP